MRQAFAAAFGIAILGFAGSAGAADLPTQGPPPVARIVPAWNINWTGVYAGFNGGYGFARTVDIPGSTSGNDSNIDGALAGAQFGGQWQSGSFVAGAEGDFQWTMQQRSITGVGFTADERLRWFGTARLRAGFAFERSLIYVTGGGAYVNLKVTAGAGSITVNDQVSHAAWTAGAGWEFMLAEHWGAKVEYLYIDAGNVTLAPFGVPVTGRLKENVARAGINYHF